jgi:hypothetical protein
MMRELYDLCDKLKGEIKNLNSKNDISPTELDRAYKAVDIIKDIKTIEAMEDYSDDGYSGRRYYYDDDMKYARDRSYRRERDSMGRYADSGHEDKEELMRKIDEMKRQLESM